MPDAHEDIRLLPQPIPRKAPLGAFNQRPLSFLVLDPDASLASKHAADRKKATAPT